MVLDVPILHRWVLSVCLQLFIYRIRSDHNSDNSTAKVKEWLNATEDLYNYVDFVYDDEDGGICTLSITVFIQLKDRFFLSSMTTNS